MSLWSDIWHTISNISDHFTPKEKRERGLANLIKQRDKLLEKQPTWTKEDSVELGKVVDRIEQLKKMKN